MAVYSLPYGRGDLKLEVDEKRVRGVLVSKAHGFKTDKSEEEIVGDSLKEPIASGRLCEITASASKVLVITSDHTRPVPSRITLPILLEEIRRSNPDVCVKILIATGCHRHTSREEMLEKFGEGLVEKEEIVNHDCRDKRNMVFKGRLPSGGELWLNSLVDWADVVVSEGFIEPHFFAGFSGGRKSILPGIAWERTVYANHCSKFIASLNARIGRLEDNPIHRDMMFAAEAAKLRFILNVVIDTDKKIIGSYAGEPSEAHKQGCTFVKMLAGVKAVAGDIIITSNGGYPLDRNIYQAVKGMTAAEACVRKGGAVIIAASCMDGHGGEEFYRWFAEAASAQEIAERISCIPQEETAADQWQAQIFARVLNKCSVILVTDMCDPKLVTDMHMHHAKTLQEALETAERLVGNDADIVIIPDGVGVIID